MWQTDLQKTDLQDAIERIKKGNVVITGYEEGVSRMLEGLRKEVAEDPQNAKKIITRYEYVIMGSMYLNEINIERENGYYELARWSWADMGADAIAEYTQFYSYDEMFTVSDQIVTQTMYDNFSDYYVYQNEIIDAMMLSMIDRTLYAETPKSMEEALQEELDDKYWMRVKQQYPEIYNYYYNVIKNELCMMKAETVIDAIEEYVIEEFIDKKLKTTKNKTEQINRLQQELMSL